MNTRLNEQSLASAQPKVTVAIPTFNRIDLLKRSVESVLAQHYPFLEIIVSDNASTDGTREYLQSLHNPSIKVLLNAENLGMVANWDRCLRAASGDYFLLMSDDDALLDADALIKFVAGFSGTGGEKIGVVFSDVILERVDRNSSDETTAKKTMYGSTELISEFFSNRVSVFPCATFFRTNDLRDLGGYASFGTQFAVDACAWMSIALKYGTIARVAEPLSIYRIHQSLSSSSVEVCRADLKVMRAIVISHRKQMTLQEFQTIENAIATAWNRVPLGYVAKRFKYDNNYGIFRAFRDIILWRRSFFSFGNFYFTLLKLFNNIK